MTSRRVMTLAVQRYDRTAALISRTVSIPSVVVMGAPPRTSVEGLLAGIYDAAEMPLARYMFLRDRGEPLTAVPIFPDRLFIQQYVYTRPDSGIRSLADLRGRRVMVTGYYITASLWHRGFLKDDHGILPEEITWHTMSQERDERMRPPQGVSVERTPSASMGVDRLLDGTVDCLMLESTPRLQADERDRVVRVHQDAGAVQREFYRRTGFHVSVHVIAVRRPAVEERPELLEELCAGFDGAKALAYGALQNERMTSLPLMRTYLDETAEIFGGDPWPYGFERNRAELDQVLGYGYDQGLLQRRLDAGELFDEPARRFEFHAAMAYGAEPFTYPHP